MSLDHRMKDFLMKNETVLVSFEEKTPISSEENDTL